MIDKTVGDEFWKELDDMIGLPSRKSGDIDTKQISDRKGISHEAAIRLMKKMAASGEYEYILVIDPTCPNGRRRILRKIIKS